MKGEMSPKEYAVFLESLKVENEGPEEMYGIRFDESLDRLKEETSSQDFYSGQFVLYLIERCRRAESQNAEIIALREQVETLQKQLTHKNRNPFSRG